MSTTENGEKRHDDQLLAMSGVHGLKDFLCSAHLLESLDGRIYSLKHFHKCKFAHQRTHEDGHYKQNPSNHELLTLRGVNCRVLLKMFGGQITLQCGQKYKVRSQRQHSQYYYATIRKVTVDVDILQFYNSVPSLRVKCRIFRQQLSLCVKSLHRPGLILL